MLSDKIKLLRKSQGLNQTEFAKRLFVTQGAVYQWETGRTTPDTSRLIAMAKEFQVPLDFFSDDKPDTTEAELIKQHLLIELGASQPKSDEAKFISMAIDKMPPKDREKAMNVLKAMYGDYFTEDKIG